MTLLTTARHLTVFLDESSPHFSTLFKIHFDSLLSPLHFIQVSLSLRFIRESSTLICLLPGLCYMPRLSYLLRFNHPVNVWLPCGLRRRSVAA
jgi:hypothetical protein